MGLMDILNGMQNGPRGPRTPGSGSGSGGMSPMTMALLGLVAYKAVKSLTGGAQTAPAEPGARGAGAAPGGGLGGLLGGLLGGGAAGSTLSGGLGDLLKQFQQGGQGTVADSWVSPGPNKAISPEVLAKVLGEDKINELSSLSGMSREELLDGLSQQLPELVDKLTPNGRVPTAQEATHMV